MSYTLQEILLMLLTVAGIAAIAVLVKLILSISKTTDEIAKVVKENRPSIDATLLDLPKITTNVTNVLHEAEGLVAELKPEIVSTLADVHNVTSQVSNITTNVSDTVEVVGIAAADTVSRFTGTVSHATNRYGVFKGLVTSLFRR